MKEWVAPLYSANWLHQFVAEQQARSNFKQSCMISKYKSSTNFKEMSIGKVVKLQKNLARKVLCLGLIKTEESSYAEIASSPR